MLLTTKKYFKEVRSKIHKTTAPWPFLTFKTEFQHLFFSTCYEEFPGAKIASGKFRPESGLHD